MAIDLIRSCTYTSGFNKGHFVASEQSFREKQQLSVTQSITKLATAN